MTTNLDIVNAAVSLIIKAALLAARFSGRARKQLSFGTAQEIIDQVVRNIEATEGRIMIGSSTEINNEVPLKNYLALHEAVLGYRY
ncbi:MAG: hypothetical protein FVQ82_16170 [Planctomycetes bacterium]|nr:hypothetical protein [Planctomycetota bacterium]